MTTNGTPCECKQVSKAQWVRLADVWVFGPAMIWAGLEQPIPRVLRWGLVALGAGTIVYNARNYYQTRRDVV
jgi:hypothetical protein